MFCWAGLGLPHKKVNMAGITSTAEGLSVCASTGAWPLLIVCHGHRAELPAPARETLATKQVRQGTNSVWDMAVYSEASSYIMISLGWTE